jgi:prepilin-type processing-associated H-X9-DG protein
LARAKEKARLTLCRSNLHQIRVGFGLYADDNNDYFPKDTRPFPILAQWCVPDDPMPTPPANGVASAIHAEAGSVFTYVTSLPRVYIAAPSPSEPDSILADSRQTNIYRVYYCPDTGPIGEMTRVTYDMNRAFDGGIGYPLGARQTAVLNPAKKILLADKTYEPALAIEWYGQGSQGMLLCSSNQIRHGGLLNVVFADGHSETPKWARALEIQSSEALSQEYLYPMGTWP